MAHLSRVILFTFVAVAPLACKRARTDDRTQAINTGAINTGAISAGAIGAGAMSARPTEPAAAPEPTSPTIVRISAHHDGTLLLDGAKMADEEILRVLKAMDPEHTIVWYYREGAQQQPHPAVARVVQAIADFAFPVSLSTQPDFSDFVGPDMQPQPRPRR